MVLEMMPVCIEDTGNESQKICYICIFKQKYLPKQQAPLTWWRTICRCHSIKLQTFWQILCVLQYDFIVQN